MTGPQDPFATPDGDPSDPTRNPYGQQQPDYGQPFGTPPQPQQSGTSPLAIGALISAFLCSPLGIVLGFVAKSQIKKTGQSGDGLATAAIVVGVLSMIVGIALYASGASTLETSP